MEKYSNLKQYWQIQFSKIDEVGLENYKKFNTAAFFFSWMWGFSKGLWQQSLIVFLLSLGLAFALPNLPAFAYMGFGLIYGLYANKWYYRKEVKKETVIF